MERCKALIQEFSNDITMEFGLDKCAVIHMKKGKVVNSPSVKSIPLLTGDDNYKYLGILQADTILHQEVKDNAKKEYFGRVRSILRKGVSVMITTSSIKIFAMPILRYGFGVIKWTQNELRSIDCKTRKILYKYKFHHPKSDTHHIYLSRKQGGRGLIGTMEFFRQECSKFAKYMYESTGDPLVRIVREAEMKKTNGIMAYREGHEKSGTTKEIDESHFEGLREKKMHGDYFRRRDEAVNINIPLSE